MLMDNETIIIIKKADATWIKGRPLEGESTYLTAQASVQPINDNELQMLEEGDRVKGTLKFYSETEILDGYFLRRSIENVAKVVTCTINDVVDSVDYLCTINSTVFRYNSGVGATAISIAAGIVAAITAGSELVSVVDNLDRSYTITSTVKGNNFTIEIDDRQYVTVNTENVTKEYKAMQDKDYSVHDIPYYKAYGFLVERQNGL